MEMIHDGEILVLAGGGPTPRFQRNKAVFWNIQLKKSVHELSFRSEIISIRTCKSIAIIVLRNQLYIYSLEDFSVKKHFETTDNPKGICSVAQISRSNYMIAFPSAQKGTVCIFDGESHSISAHNGSIVCVEFNSDGSLLATASENGTLIRIFNTNSKELLMEFRRGSTAAKIYSLAFSSSDEFLASSSSNGTVHIFQIKSKNSTQDESYFQTSRYFINDYLPSYFKSTYSFAQFSIPKGTESVVAFGEQTNIINVICANGYFYRAKFNTESGGQAESELVVQISNNSE